MILRVFEPSRDRAAVEALWDEAIAPVWPVLPRALDAVPHGVVAEVDGALAGFAGVDGDTIALLAVRPGRQRRGIGSALLDRAVELGVTRAGGGAVWPGVPLDLPAGVAFFTARGWTARPDVADLTQDLRSFEPPADVPGVHVELVDPLSVRWFEDAEFPAWTRHFTDGRHEAAAARAPDRRIIGSLLLSGPDADTAYAPLLGARSGHIACVGVERARHGEGVGSAMVAFAATVLRDRGVRTCLVDWVERESFYARLGFTSWRRHRPFTRG